MTGLSVISSLERRRAFSARLRLRIPAFAQYLPAFLTALAVVCGIALRLIAFTADHSLWIDEAMLALNIVERTPAQLFEPLGHNQGAPVGFLLACKASVSLFGPSEFALRLTSFIASILGLFAFAFTAFQLLPKPAARLALWLFALAPYLVAYSAECKQYSTDAACCAGLLALAAGLLNGRTEKWRWLALALGGVVAVWFSHPSLFVAAGLGVALIVKAWLAKDRSALIASILMGLAWILSFVVVYLVNLRHLGENRYLQDYWAGYFLKFPSQPSEAFWIVEKFGQFLAYPGGMAMIAALPVILGMIAFARQENGKFLLTALLGPFAFTLLASALQKYPFCGRLLIFLVPILILLAARGMAELAEMLGKSSRLAAILALTFFFVAPALESRELLRHPKHAEELKPVLRELQSQWQPGDRLYVYNGSGDAGAGPAFDFYAPQFRFPQEAIILGGIHRSDPTRYLDEVRAIPGGGRVWLLISHEHRDEATMLRAYFESTRKGGTEIVRPGSAAYAYDER
jgi:hypothetical protein